MISLVKQAAKRFNQFPRDYGSIINCIGDKTQVVLIGEASHGTHEFYLHRAEITKRLIQEKGYTIIAVEADWPDAYRVNQYVRSHIPSRDKNAQDALKNFKRFPRWMWRNTVMVDFIEWLKKHNYSVNSPPDETGFYGLDLYSLQSSREAVINYLETVDHNLAERARQHYGCFNRFGNDTGAYGYQTGLGLSASCEREVVQVLKEMLQNQTKLLQNDLSSEDQYFYAKQNAKVVVDAESYYRNMFTSTNTWNIRDGHMTDILTSLIEDLTAQSHIKQLKKAVVWAHNSHLGDAYYTESYDRGEINIGHLTRKRFGLDKTFIIGFTSYTGFVTAAHNWDEDPHHMKVMEGMDDSYEKLFHSILPHLDQKHFGNGQFLLNFRANNPHAHDELASAGLHQLLSRRILERMIGVLYRPATERYSHYVLCEISNQFDSVIHLDKTNALEPLEIHPQWTKGRKDQIPETYPFGV